jgi:hypothetical protein
MYTLKKHLQEDPVYNDVVLSKLKRYEFENLKTSKWAKSIIDKQHNSYEVDPPSTAPIQSEKQVTHH